MPTNVGLGNRVRWTAGSVNICHSTAYCTISTRYCVDFVNNVGSSVVAAVAVYPSTVTQAINYNPPPPG